MTEMVEGKSLLIDQSLVIADPCQGDRLLEGRCNDTLCLWDHCLLSLH